jgi:hypothetical protein
VLCSLLHCSVLRAVLPDKGYTAHVLGFTAAALLQAHVAAGISPGQLDEALPLLLPTLEGDLFGSVSSLLVISGSWFYLFPC